MSKKVTIELDLSDEQADALQELLAQLADPGDGSLVTLEDLMDVLVDDLHLVVRRPGSWEGANMADVLVAHGYLAR